MKKIIIIFLGIIFLSGCKPSEKEINEATEFYNKIADNVKPVTDDFNLIMTDVKNLISLALIDTLKNNDIEPVNLRIELFLTKIDSISSIISKFEEFDDKIKFKEYILKYLTATKSLAKNDLNTIIKLLENGLNDQEITEIQDILLKMYDKITENEAEKNRVSHEFISKYS